MTPLFLRHTYESAGRAGYDLVSQRHGSSSCSWSHSDGDSRYSYVQAAERAPGYSEGHKTPL